MTAKPPYPNLKCFLNVFVALLLLTAGLFVLAGTTSQEPVLVAVSGEPTVVRTSHTPIDIDSDSDFATTASSNGWKGTGTAANPYIIENYEINGNGYTHCIKITKTTKYFEIRNCTLKGADTFTIGFLGSGAGLHLSELGNGTIINVTATDCYSYSYAHMHLAGWGFYLSNCHNLTLMDCNTSSNDVAGYSDNIPYTTYAYGMVLAGCQDIDIINHTATKNDATGSPGQQSSVIDGQPAEAYGIYGSGSSRVTIRTSRIFKNTATGGSVASGPNNGAGGQGRSMGIKFSTSDNIMIDNCNSSNNQGFGGDSYYSGSFGISGAMGFAYGILVADSSMVIINNSLAKNNNALGGKGSGSMGSGGQAWGTGIRCEYTNNITIMNSSCLKNKGSGGSAGMFGGSGIGWGLYFAFAEDAYVEYSNFDRQSGVATGMASGTAYGAEVKYSTRIMFKKCSFSYNEGSTGMGLKSGIGLIFDDSDNATVQFCDCLNNGFSAGTNLGSGFRLLICEDIKIEHSRSINNAPGGNGYGVFAQTCERIDLNDLNVTKNGQYGIHFDTVYDSFISYSEIMSNGRTTGGAGISIYNSFDNEADNNTLIKNGGGPGFGIYLTMGAGNNLIVHNVIVKSTTYGMYVQSTGINNIHHNSFVDNNAGGIQALDDSINNWDDGSEGNYWSDYVPLYAPPATHNGVIWDTSYPIFGGTQSDDYPLVRGEWILSVITPVRIDSDADFDVAHGVTGGTGTAADPWIIDNWEIDGDGWGWCFFIGNTTEPYVIRNCTFYDAGDYTEEYYMNTGLLIGNSTSGEIVNTTSSGNGDGTLPESSFSGIGFAIFECNYMNFTDCIGDDNELAGFMSINSENCSVMQSNFSNTRGFFVGIGIGVFCVESKWMFFDNVSTFYNDPAAFGIGLAVFESNNCTLNNIVSVGNGDDSSGGTSGMGIMIEESADVTILNSQANYNSGQDMGAGVMVNDAQHCKLRNVSALYNGYASSAGIGIQFENTGNSSYTVGNLSYNIGGGFGIGLNWIASNNITCSDVEVYTESIGFNLEDSHDNNISSSEIKLIQQRAIAFTDSHRNNVWHNDFVTIGGRACYLEDSDHNTLMFNNFTNAVTDFYLQRADWNEMGYNTLVDTIQYGMGSCPFLYTWNGDEMEFYGDINGMGGLGYSFNMSRLGGQALERRAPTPTDYTVIDSSQLAAKDGYYEIELVEEQDEITYFDSAELWVIDHSGDVEVYNPEAALCFQSPGPYTPVVHTVADPQAPESVTDWNGKDISDVVAEYDGVYTDAQMLNDNHIEIDFGDLSGASQIKLLYGAHTDWSPIGALKENVYAEVPDASGDWVLVSSSEHLGKPEALPRVWCWDITSWFKTDDYRLRLHTGNVKIHVDYIAYDTSVDETVKITKVQPSSAELYFKGPEHASFEYFYGDFTRYGDVLALSNQIDDKFVIMRDGDALTLRFPEQTAPLEDRDYMLVTEAYFKQPFVKYLLGEDDSKVEPLPYHGMTNYPYYLPDKYPDTLEYNDYLDIWNTRACDFDDRVGMSLPNSHNNTVHHNHIDGGNSAMGLIIDNEQDTKVFYNEIHDLDMGIYVNQGVRLLMEGNVIYNTSDEGFYLGNSVLCRFTQNQLENIGTFGFQLQGNNRYIWIDNNTVFEANTGLTLSNENFVLIENNTFEECSVLGLNIQNSNVINVDNNDLSGNGYSNIFFNNIDMFNITNNNIEGTGYVDDSLVLDMWMDEVSWTGAVGEVEDRSGLNNHGQAYGDADTVNGSILGATGWYDGTDDYVQCGNDSSLDLGDNFAIEAWIYIENGGKWQTIVSKTPMNSATSISYWFRISSGNLLSFVASDGVTSDIRLGTNALSVQTWYHVGVTTEGGNYRFYINGNSMGSTQTKTITSQVNDANVTIGALEDGSFEFDGAIDMVKIYNRSLAFWERDQNYLSVITGGVYVQDSSWGYIHSNWLENNFKGLQIRQCDDTMVWNNYFGDPFMANASQSTNILWNVSRQPGMNILGGNYVGGNYWWNYTGLDLNGDWLGDTDVPHAEGDYLPLVYEHVAPFMTDHTIGNPTTGDQFTLRCEATDLGGLDIVTVEYWFGSGAHSNVTMSPGAPDHTLILDVPHSLDPLHYIFHAVDIGGNWNRTSEQTLDVIDNDIPLILSIIKPTTVQFGDGFVVEVEAWDNIEVALAKVNYTDTVGSWHNVSMSLSNGNWTFTIPGQTTLGSVTFTIWVNDTSNNFNTTGPFDVEIFDDGKPVVTIDSPAEGALVKGLVNITITATDSISGIKWVAIDTESSTRAALYNATPTSGTFWIEWDSTLVSDGLVAIIAKAGDQAGNSIYTSINVTVDNTPPVASAGENVEVYEGTLVEFNGTGSSDTNGIVSYAWVFIYDGVEATLTGERPSFTFDKIGVYNVTLTVIDTVGHKTTDGMVVTVLEKPEPPARPKVVETDPKDGATGVVLDAEIVITFNMPMNTANVEEVLNISGGVSYTTSWNANKTILSITFDDLLEYETTYSVAIGDAKSSEGGLLIDAPYKFAFTTLKDSGPVIPPPPENATLTITSPGDSDIFDVNETITVNGTSQHLEGKQLTIEIDGETYTTTIGTDGTWSVDITLPSEEGDYVIYVSYSSLKVFVNIEVKEGGQPPQPDDDDDDDDSEFLSGFAWFLIVLAIILVIVIIVVIVIVVTRSKKKDEEEPPTEDEDEEETEKSGPVDGEDEGDADEDEDLEEPDLRPPPPPPSDEEDLEDDEEVWEAEDEEMDFDEDEESDLDDDGPELEEDPDDEDLDDDEDEEDSGSLDDWDIDE